MKTITVTFEISEERLLQALSNLGDLKQNVDITELRKAFSEDVENYVNNGLIDFLEEGVNCDVYSDFFKESDDYEDEE